MYGPDGERANNMLQALFRDIISHESGDGSMDPRKSDDIENNDVFFGSSFSLRRLSFIYVQAHIRILQPFSFDTPLQRIVLLRTETSSAADIHITASLVELSCLAGKFQGLYFPLMAQGNIRTSWNAIDREIRCLGPPRGHCEYMGPGRVCDPAGWCGISACHEDQRRIYKSSISELRSRGISLGSPPQLSATPRSLDLGREILIRSLVATSTVCKSGREAGLGDVGRHHGNIRGARGMLLYHESTEYQLGLQGGSDHLLR